MQKGKEEYLAHRADFQRIENRLLAQSLSGPQYFDDEHDGSYVVAGHHPCNPEPVRREPSADAGQLCIGRIRRNSRSIRAPR
jgi:hypothetical protein